MFATVSPTRSLRCSLYYDRALRSPEKGGEVIMANGVGLYSSPTAQLSVMEKYSNPKFRVKAYSVIISHSDEDNDRLKDHKFQELLLHEYVNACKKRGIDLDNIPYIIPEHINTDNIHYHMLMLINRFDGTRINTHFIGKRMALAAVDVSKKYELHYPKGWDVREKNRQKYLASATTAPAARDNDGKGDGKQQHEMEHSSEQPRQIGLGEDEERKLKDRIRRRKAVLEAKKRKEDEARRQEERGSKERVQVQEQNAKGREKVGKGDREHEAKRERKTRWHR